MGFLNRGLKCRLTKPANQKHLLILLWDITQPPPATACPCANPIA